MTHYTIVLTKEERESLVYELGQGCTADPDWWPALAAGLDKLMSAAPAIVWTPVPQWERIGCACGDPECNANATLESSAQYIQGTLSVVGKGGVDHGDVILPDDVRMCRLMPVASEAQS